MRNLYCLDQAPAGNAGLMGYLINGGLALFGLSALALWWWSPSDSSAEVQKLNDTVTTLQSTIDSKTKREAALQSKIKALEVAAETGIYNRSMSKVKDDHLMKDDKRFDHDSQWSIFAKIASREPKFAWAKPTGGDFIFETENVIAFLDLRPVSRGHSLLVTKHPYASIMDMPPHIAGELLRELPRLARIVQKVTKADGISILSSNGDITGQNKFVSSASFHVIPWYKGDDTNEEHTLCMYINKDDVTLSNKGHDRNNIRYSATDTALKPNSNVSFKMGANVFEGTLTKQVPSW